VAMRSSVVSLFRHKLTMCTFAQCFPTAASGRRRIRHHFHHLSQKFVPPGVKEDLEVLGQNLGPEVGEAKGARGDERIRQRALWHAYTFNMPSLDDRLRQVESWLRDNQGYVASMREASERRSWVEMSEIKSTQ
jgi:hypothetical protein